MQVRMVSYVLHAVYIHMSSRVPGLSLAPRATLLSAFRFTPYFAENWCFFHFQLLPFLLQHLMLLFECISSCTTHTLLPLWSLL